MRKKFLIAGIPVTAFAIFFSCDYVRNANPPPTGAGGTVCNPPVVYRKAMIEDYTGHRCGNCPAAARELHRLDSTYPGKIVPIAVHAGFYATLNSQYPTDLRSQAGTDYDNFFGNSAAGNPNGLVARKGWGSASFIEQWSDWDANSDSIYTKRSDFKIDISSAYNAGANQVTATVTVTALSSKSTQAYNLVVLLTEDSIIAEQIDYAATPQFTTTYLFNHVLRGALNGSWGDTLFKGTINPCDVKTKTISNFQLSSGWKHQHCHVIAFLYDADPTSTKRYEVLQVESKDVN